MEFMHKLIYKTQRLRMEGNSVKPFCGLKVVKEVNSTSFKLVGW